MRGSRAWHIGQEIERVYEPGTRIERIVARGQIERVGDGDIYAFGEWWGIRGGRIARKRTDPIERIRPVPETRTEPNRWSDEMTLRVREEEARRLKEQTDRRAELIQQAIDTVKRRAETMTDAQIRGLIAMLGG